MSGFAEASQSTPGLLEEALQNAYEAGYKQCLEDFQNNIQKMMNNIKDVTPTITIVGRRQNWPTLNNNVVTFNGKEVMLTNREVCGFQPLLDAKGEIVSFKKMLEFYGGSKHARDTAIHHLRKSLKQIPEIEIENFGNGQRLVIHD